MRRFAGLFLAVVTFFGGISVLPGCGEDNAKTADIKGTPATPGSETAPNKGGGQTGYPGAVKHQK